MSTYIEIPNLRGLNLTLPDIYAVFIVIEIPIKGI